MGLELRYERLAVARRAVENAAESVVEGSVTLPDGAHEIGRPLRLVARPRTGEVEVRDDKVFFEGALDLDLLYAYFEERRAADFDDEEDVEADGRDVVVEERLGRASWREELPFAFVLDLPGVREGQPVEAEVTVKECSFEVRSDRMTLDVDVSLQFEAGVGTVQEATVATGVDGAQGVQTGVRTVRVRNFLGTGSAEALAEGSLALSGRAEPTEVLDVRAVADAVEAVADDGSVRVKGSVSYEVLCGCDGAGLESVTWRKGASFETVIPVAGARRGARAEARVTPRESRVHIVRDDGGGRLEVRTPVSVAVEVVQVKEVPLITSLTADEGEVATRFERLSLYEAVGEGVIAETAEGSLDLPEGSPGIERVLGAEARAVVDDVHVLGDKVAVELHVDVEVLYLGRERGESGVHVARWPGALTLDVEVPVDGAEPGLERRVRVSADRVEVDPINRESLDVRVWVSGIVAVSREVETEVVAEAVEVPPLESNPPTYTFVVIEPGETLWRLAARYRSEPEAILAVNPWLASADAPLPEGRKLCVPRRVARQAG